MKLQQLKDYLDDYSLDFYFQVNKKDCGIETEVKNYIPTFTLWYGDFYRDYKDKDLLVNDKIFDGKSLRQLLPKLNIEVY
ncbi:hypothetical protein J2Z60_000166 [Lactobacillus colini]|uniref:Uncharacterized protein n=1 Tax=Lactobacillus colini TaxID=1819254 RepID=A0ABS4MC81_9LACO|nr:hypothetical protein [Lactobacillus colini]MBP2057004.1 hypothetical protein [Lactobacillus colini]